MGSEQARKRQNSLQRNHRGIQNTYHTWLTFSHSLLCREATVKSPQLILMAFLHPGVTTPCLSYREYFTGGRGNHPLPGVINSFKMLPEKAMAPHSSTLAWKIPWTKEPGGLPSLGSQSRTRLKRLSSSSSSNNAPKPIHSPHQASQ